YFILEKKKSGAYKIRGHKNLHELRQRIGPKVLRRKKEEVLSDLPDRVDNNYFVDLTPEQREPYDEFRARAASLMARAQKRPLNPAEEKNLLKALTKMRIICDALELHDRSLDAEAAERTRPKIRELEGILREQVSDGGRKALVFSQWEGMIDIASLLVEKMELGWVKLCGSVPSKKRGRLIEKFRDDPEVRVFLSTDAGSVGLNLQSANLVVNLDVPWNPAVLDQRVGRTHRIGQHEVVNVVNLVARDTIEERVLDALETKRNVFEGVFGAEAEAPDTVSLGGQGILAARLRDVFSGEDSTVPPVADHGPASAPTAGKVGVKPRDEEPYEALADKLLPRLHDKLLLIRPAPAVLGAGKVLVVVDGPLDIARPAVEEALADVGERFGLPGPPPWAAFDREGYRSLLTLAGVEDESVEGYRAPSFTDGLDAGRAGDSGDRARAKRALAWIDEGRNRLAFGHHAMQGGFPLDALPPFRKAVVCALKALVILQKGDPSSAADPGYVDEILVRPGILPESLTGPLFLTLSAGGDDLAPTPPTLRKIASTASEIVERANERVIEALA
ncbi:MAG: DEAD/DEAH box helicase, partial [Planctomycetota bacterium]